MLLINRDSVIFFLYFFYTYQNTSTVQKTAACSFMEGYRSPAAYAARLFLIGILACRPTAGRGKEIKR
mgnify:CR=1 FL=1